MRIERAVLWRAQCAAIVLGGTLVALDSWMGIGVHAHMWVDVIVGGAAIAVGFAVGHCRYWCGFILASLGVWLTMAAFNPQLVHQPGLCINNLIVGSALALVGLITIVLVEAPDRNSRRGAGARVDLHLVSGLWREAGR